MKYTEDLNLLEVRKQNLTSNTTTDDFKYDRVNRCRVNCPEGCLHGLQLFLNEDGLPVSRECSCRREYNLLARLEESGLEAQDYSWKYYKNSDVQSIGKKAIQFLHECRSNKPYKWFIITGRPGSGKTQISTLISIEMIAQGYDVRYMLWKKDSDRLKMLRAESSERYRYQIEKFENAPVLLIDDFFKGTVTDTDQNIAYEILNERYNARSKITIISSELSLGEICDINEAIGSRITQRTDGFTLRTPDTDYRLIRHKS